MRIKHTISLISDAVVAVVERVGAAIVVALALSLSLVTCVGVFVKVDSDSISRSSKSTVTASQSIWCREQNERATAPWFEGRSVYIVVRSILLVSLSMIKNCQCPAIVFLLHLYGK